MNFASGGTGLGTTAAQRPHHGFRHDPSSTSSPPPAGHDSTQGSSESPRPLPTQLNGRSTWPGTSTWHTGKRHNIAPPRCLCNLQARSMPHLLWKCKALQAQRRRLAPRLPVNTSAWQQCPRPLHPTNQTISAPPALTHLLDQQLKQALHTVQPLVIATDGGATHGCAAWAVAVDGGTCAQALHGEDTTPMMAELTAILYFIITITQLAHQPILFDLQVILAVDCQSAIQFLDRGPIPSQHFHLWHLFQQHRRRALDHGLRLHFQWTPAHGKHGTWQPPLGGAGHLRHLNHQATVRPQWCCSASLCISSPGWGRIPVPPSGPRCSTMGGLCGCTLG
eukprot:s6007_g6.t1